MDSAGGVSIGLICATSEALAEAPCALAVARWAIAVTGCSEGAKAMLTSTGKYYIVRCGGGDGDETDLFLFQSAVAVILPNQIKLWKN